MNNYLRQADLVEKVMWVLMILPKHQSKIQDIFVDVGNSLLFPIFILVLRIIMKANESVPLEIQWAIVLRETKQNVDPRGNFSGVRNNCEGTNGNGLIKLKGNLLRVLAKSSRFPNFFPTKKVRNGSVAILRRKRNYFVS